MTSSVRVAITSAVAQGDFKSLIVTVEQHHNGSSARIAHPAPCLLTLYIAGSVIPSGQNPSGSERFGGSPRNG
jgi:hypothetical protein